MSLKESREELEQIQRDMEQIQHVLGEMHRSEGEGEGDSELAITEIDELGNGSGKIATVSQANDPNAPEILLVDEHLQDPFAIGHSEAKQRVEQADDARFMSRAEMKALVDEEDWTDRFNLLRDKDSNERTLRSQ